MRGFVLLATNSNPLKIKLLLVALIFSAHLYGQDKYSKIDEQLTKCLDSSVNQTTTGMCNCTYRALNQWDDRLNITYKELLKKLDAAGKLKLVDAQREWVKYRDKEITLVNVVYSKASGTMWIPVKADKIMEITRKRALELMDILDTMAEF